MHGEDTLIGQKNYTKIMLCDSSYRGALRDSAGKVFLIPPNSSNEKIVYDFTLNPGDTIHDFYPSPSYAIGALIIADSVDTVTINGLSRRRIHLESGVDWIEGIGSSGGFLADNFYNANIYISLFCMSEDSITIYPNQSNRPCNITVDISEIKQQRTELKIYPNPVKDFLSIESKEIIEEVLIYDIKGNLLRNESSKYFSVSNFKSGIYFIRISSNSQVIYRRFVKE
jgi:hypothetical protein